MILAAQKFRGGWRSGWKEPDVILNGVSPWAQAGAKRSEEPSPRDSAGAEAGGAILTVMGGGGLVRCASIALHRLRPFRVSDASLRSCRKASRNSAQHDGLFFRTDTPPICQPLFRFLITRISRLAAGFAIRIPRFLPLLLAVICTAHAETVETFDGKKITGAVTFDIGQFTVAPPGGAALKVDPAEVLRVQFTDALPVENFMPGVVLRNGSRVTGPFGSLTEPLVKFDRYKIALPGGEIAWVIYQPVAADVAASAPAGKTGALLAGGDFFEGSIKGADDKSAKVLNPIFGPRTLVGSSRDLLALILRDPRRNASLFEVRTKDGALFGVDALTLDRTGVTLRHPLYEGLKIAAENLVEIRAGSGRYQPLTALKPARVDPQPGRKLEQCFAVDKSLGDVPLDSLGAAHGKGFESAVGVAATWEVPAGFNVLHVLVAVPPGVPPAHRLIFAVYADGRPITRSAPLSSNDQPTALRAQFGGVRRISLRVEASFPPTATGSGLWLDPVLIRK